MIASGHHSPRLNGTAPVWNTVSKNHAPITSIASATMIIRTPPTMRGRSPVRNPWSIRAKPTAPGINAQAYAQLSQ